MASSLEGYRLRAEQQIRQYEREGSVQPPQPETAAYHTKHYLQRRFRDVFGVNNHIEFYYEPLARSIRRTRCGHVASIGCGECDLELLVAQGLVKLGISDFTIHAIELSPILIERAEIKVRNSGLENNFVFRNLDVIDWSPAHPFAGYMAHHSLHHLVHLEHLFTEIRSSLLRGGYFLSCDMIGRNGHMRWPEAKQLLDRLWPLLSTEQRFHNLWNQLWTTFINHDCSSEGFEGIRAQEILPLLVREFYFDAFLAYGGLIDVFTDRAFGPNFSMENERDRAFIDFVALLNDVLIETGHLKPTVMFARMTVEECLGTRVYKHLSPKFCVRPLEGQ